MSKLFSSIKVGWLAIALLACPMSMATAQQTSTDVQYLQHIAYELQQLLKTIKKAKRAPSEFPDYAADLQRVYNVLEGDLFEVQKQIDRHIRNYNGQPRRYKVD